MAAGAVSRCIPSLLARQSITNSSHTSRTSGRYAPSCISLKENLMPLLFKGSDLRPVLAEAIANQCRVILVKDQGVYWLAEHGECRPDGRQKLIAYAIGCNPDVDPFDDWWELART